MILFSFLFLCFSQVLLTFRDIGKHWVNFEGTTKRYYQNKLLNQPIDQKSIFDLKTSPNRYSSCFSLTLFIRPSVGVELKESTN